MQLRKDDCRYASWELRRIAIPESPQGKVRWLDALESVLVECIPALEVVELDPLVLF
jgi:hypothetical protein